MSLEKQLKKIKAFLLNRYKNNLAAILIFGSANTKHFREGKSDIDTIILLKEQKDLNLEQESKFLLEKLKREYFATQYFFTLQGIKEYIQRRNSWRTYITIVAKDGSKILYSTAEFKGLQKKLLENPPSKKEIIAYLKERDYFKLDEYLKKSDRYPLTKKLMSHFRMKLQMYYYLNTGKLVYDYKKCLRQVKLKKEEKQKLIRIYNQYKEKEGLSKKEAEDYYKLSKDFTKQILNL